MASRKCINVCIPKYFMAVRKCINICVSTFLALLEVLSIA